MSESIFDYQTRSLLLARRYDQRMPEHQRITYAVEQVVEEVLPLPVWGEEHLTDILHDICLLEDVDAPMLEQWVGSRGFTASANRSRYTIHVGGPVSTMTLCHELAHCLAGEGHDDEWRERYVGLVRRHVGVEHAALLCKLFTMCGLKTKWSNP